MGLSIYLMVFVGESIGEWLKIRPLSFFAIAVLCIVIAHEIAVSNLKTEDRAGEPSAQNR